jgi:serine/threonine protein kinase
MVYQNLLFVSTKERNKTTRKMFKCMFKYFVTGSKFMQGMLRNGLVAVKRIRNDRTIREKIFQREVTSLLNISHKNIVRFLGFCSHTIHKCLLYEGQHVYAENRDRLLCFEYINNGSLETYITGTF